MKKIDNALTDSMQEFQILDIFHKLVGRISTARHQIRHKSHNVIPPHWKSPYILVSTALIFLSCFIAWQIYQKG